MGCGASKGQVVDGQTPAPVAEPKAYTAPVKPIALESSQSGHEAVKPRIALDGQSVDSPEADSDTEDRGTPKEIISVGPSFKPVAAAAHDPKPEPKNKPAAEQPSNKVAMPTNKVAMPSNKTVATPAAPATAAAPPASTAVKMPTAAVRPPEPLSVKTNNLPDLKPKQSFVPALIFNDERADSENNPNSATSLPKSPSHPTHMTVGPDGNKALPELHNNGRPKPELLVFDFQRPLTAEKKSSVQDRLERRRKRELTADAVKRKQVAADARRAQQQDEKNQKAAKDVGRVETRRKKTRELEDKKAAQLKKILEEKKKHADKRRAAQEAELQARKEQEAKHAAEVALKAKKLAAERGPLDDEVAKQEIPADLKESHTPTDADSLIAAPLSITGMAMPVSTLPPSAASVSDAPLAVSASGTMPPPSRLPASASASAAAQSPASAATDKTMTPPSPRVSAGLQGPSPRVGGALPRPLSSTNAAEPLSATGRVTSSPRLGALPKLSPRPDSAPKQSPRVLQPLRPSPRPGSQPVEELVQ